MKKLFVATAAFFCSLILLSGCAGKETDIEFSSKANYFFSMNAEATLVISDIFTNEKEKKYTELCNQISTALNSINNSLASNIENSSINKFNTADAGDMVEIDIAAYNVLSLAKSVYELTDGYYNPAVYYSVQAYGFNESTDLNRPLSERIPADSVIEKYNQLTSAFGEIQLYKSEDNKCYATKPDVTVELDGTTYSMKIDLGGIGKGYAVDEVNKLIDDYGFKYGYFSFGTSSILVKEHYKNGEYTLGFTNPRSDADGNVYSSIAVKNECISTSGDYEQFFLYDSDGDGEKEWYCHIFNPKTGRPIQTGIMSATVIGGSAMQDDALTTAIMAMGKQKAVEFINENLSDKKVIFTFDNNGSYEIITNIASSEINVSHNKFKIVSTVSDGKILLG